MMKKTVKLNNGIEMPILGFGTWRVHDTQPMKWAIEEGYELIDTAVAYENEKLVGKAVKESGIKREDIFITTKIPNFQYDDVEGAYKACLKRLDLEYTDLLLCHSYKSEKRVEAYKVLEKLYKEKKCRAIGVSNFNVEHLKELLDKTEIVPAVNQVEFHVFCHQKELLDFCKEKDIVLQAYMPLGRSRVNLDNETLKKIADKHSKSVPQIMIRWLIQKGIPTIPKSDHKERIIMNKEVFDFELSEEDMEALDNIPDQRAYCTANPEYKETMIIGITGTLGAGKGTIVEYLKKRGFVHFSAREDVINKEIARRGMKITRDAMREVANDLREKYGPSHVAEELFSMANKTGKNAVLESLRAVGEIEKLREKKNFICLAVDADQKTRYERITKRKNAQSDDVSFEKFKEQEEAEMNNNDPSKQDLKGCIEIADFIFDNNGTKKDLYEQVEQALEKVRSKR